MTIQTAESARMIRWRFALEMIALVLVIGMSGTLISIMFLDRHRPGPPAPSPRAARRILPPPPRDPIPLEGAALKGSRSAKVAIIEYSEFECPYCATFVRETLPALERTYVTPGKVLLAFRHFPLESLHPSALIAAAAAECAGRQGKFWEMHDALFRDPRQLDRPAVQDRARAIGLEGSQFTDCLEGPATARIRRDAAAAKELGISGTPTFFIGRLLPDASVKVTHRIPGAQPFARFQAILDDLLTSVRVEPE